MTALDLCKKLDYEVKVLLCGPPLTVIGGGVLELDPIERRQTGVLLLAWRGVPFVVRTQLGPRTEIATRVGVNAHGSRALW